jgi:peptide/nickel transport system ATP-binding protein
MSTNLEGSRTMDEPLLKITNLSVEYKTDQEIIKAVNNISLSIDRRQTFGIVGETGAGKTTTALSILRLLPARIGSISSGTILFDGVDLLSMNNAGIRGIRGERISMIFQDPMTSLNPVHTVGAQILEALALHNNDKKTIKELQARVDEMLELVGIPAARKTEYPHQFSGGMKQRVVIAVALACNPELLIADEPTTALDVTIQAQVISMMLKLKEKLGTSMIMITHDMGVIAQTCDKVAVMYAGEIIESGTVYDIFEGDFHHPYTKGLFNSIPNLETESHRLCAIPGLMPDPTNLPSGCKFHPRCDRRMPICNEKHPTGKTIGQHVVRCHLYSDESVS